MEYVDEFCKRNGMAVTEDEFENSSDNIEIFMYAGQIKLQMDFVNTAWAFQ